MRPILVAGTTGQLARSMVDIGEQRAIPVVAVGRPKLDLENAEFDLPNRENRVATGHRQCGSIHGRRHGRIGTRTRVRN